MDTPGIGFELLIVILLILANGVFAMTEMAIVSSRKSRLEQMQDSGVNGARRALQLANEPNHMLSTVQVGITLIGILTGAFGSGAIARELSQLLKTIPLLAKYSDFLGLGIVVAAITYLSLIIGELVPKRLALAFPEKIAVVIAGPMSLFAVITKPVVQLLSISTQAILRLFAIKPSTDPPVTEDEIRILINQGTESGIFEETEKDMVDRVFLLNDIRIGALMTPRTQIEWLNVESEPAAILATCLQSRHSWLPVAQGKIDTIIGVVFVKELLIQHIAGKPVDLAVLARDILYIPKNMRALKALELLKQSGAEIALIADEYGGVSGLVTLDDILEEIVDDMPSAAADEDPDIVQREDGSWLISGMLPIEEFKDLFDLAALPGEDRDHFHTLGGFVVSYLGYIPGPAAFVQWNGLRIEVVDMDRTRVDKLLITRLPSPDEQPLNT
ncbi:MAG: hemolysin family protein [Sporomusaceae bacterium]|nr:hemolysin family protein [Sporomusaceae bacterium]